MPAILIDPAIHNETSDGFKNSFIVDFNFSIINWKKNNFCKD